jgi:hypothetical protein
VTTSKRHPVVREIALALVFKALALALLYVAFFSPAQRTLVTPEAMSQALLGAEPR